MTCKPFPVPVYRPNKNGGVKLCDNHGTGDNIGLDWDKAWPTTNVYNVGYNIYFSTNRDNVFTEYPKYVSILQTNCTAEIFDLTPGETYYFAVRAFQYDPAWYDLSALPDGSPDTKIYPETVLTADIADNDLVIPIADIADFPDYGVILAGTELIRYSSRDVPNSSLIVSTLMDRGFLDSNVRSHAVDGYDGYYMQSPIIRFFWGFEEDNAVVIQETSGFHYPTNAYTVTDGYKTQVKDNLTTDLTASDSTTIEYRPYDYVGWHRTDPTLLVAGSCVGTYIGGELYCADSEGGVGMVVRGISLNEQANQREEILLSTTGEPCVLIKRERTGIRCKCFMPTMEQPEARCGSCFGTGFVVGFEQFFNPKRSDGRIMVRFDPTTDDLVQDEDGMESVLSPTAWTLAYPAVKDRDLLVRYDEDGAREFMYEIINVTRNKLFLNSFGAQKMTVQRVRKTDIYNQVKIMDDSSTIPVAITSSIGFIRGASGLLIPHTHTVMTNEHTVSIAQISQLTSVSSGHNHEVISGVVTAALGHTHTFTI